MPLSKNDDAMYEEEGMIGKLLNVAKTNHQNVTDQLKENQTTAKTRFDENREEIKNFHSKIDKI